MSETAEELFGEQSIFGEQPQPEVGDAFDTTRVPLRFHMLKASDRSLQHAYRKIRAAAEDDEETREMRIGAACHALVLNTVHVVAAPMPRDSRKSNWLEFEKQHMGSLIVTKKEYDTASYMADAIRRHPDASALLGERGVVFEETRIFEREVRGEATKRECRATVDFGLDQGFIADIKSSDEIAPEIFRYQMKRYDVWGQMEHYTQAWPGTRAVYIVAVESKTCIVQVYELDERDLAAARERNLIRLERIVDAEERNHWPAYGMDIMSIRHPDG